MILVCLLKTSLLMNVLAPHIDKKQIRSSKNMEMLSPDGSLILKITQLNFFQIAKFRE